MKSPLRNLAPRLSLALACLLALPLGLGANEQAQEPSLNFSVYLWSEPSGKAQAAPTRTDRNGEAMVRDYVPVKTGFIDKNGQLNNFDLTARSFSQSQEYKGPSPLVFAVEQPGSTQETPLYREVGRVAVPQNIEEGILFFFPKDNSTEPSYNISLLPSGPKDIPAGQALVVNLSGTPIATKLGDQRIALQPEGVQKVSISGLENNRLPVMLAAQEDGEWQLKLQRNISMLNNTALLILFHQDNGTYRIENIRLRR